jgi:hypothetical protein
MSDMEDSRDKDDGKKSIEIRQIRRMYCYVFDVDRDNFDAQVQTVGLTRTVSLLVSKLKDIGPLSFSHSDATGWFKGYLSIYDRSLYEVFFWNEIIKGE